MTQVVKPSRWEAFVSLTWYDSAISFLFRFVSKTAEPLLAVGVIVSAADFLQHGRLMRGNVALENTWAWTQALAIEASTGPVLVFALQAFRAKDSVKGWLYTFLASLLFFVGGSMLLLQLISSVSRLDETSINPWVLYGLFLLRVIVSGGMVALSCTKHIRFSGTDSETAGIPSETAIPNLKEILESLDERYAQRMQTTIETITQTVTKTVIQQITVTSAETPLQLPETSESKSEEPSVPDEEQTRNRKQGSVTEERREPVAWALPSVSGIATEDIEQVISTYLSGVPRREICTTLRWGSNKYSTIVKPVLDAWEQQKQSGNAA